MKTNTHIDDGVTLIVTDSCISCQKKKSINRNSNQKTHINDDLIKILNPFHF